MAPSVSQGPQRDFAVIQFFGRATGFLSVCLLVVTVSVLPWMLGGVVPLARLVLLAGSILAAVFSLVSCLCLRRISDAVPAVALPLIGLALLGTFQLRPGDVHPAIAMEHAVVSPVVPADSPGGHTLSPADTRNTISITLALALLAFSAFAQLRAPVAIVSASVVLILNALVIGGIGMSQVFGAKEFSWNARWMLGWSHGKSTFASFVNPNNAAGWMCLAVAITAGWSMWFSKPSSTSPKLRRGRLRISFAGRFWQRSVETLAELTVWQTLMFAATAFAAAGVAATQSRGGILALIIGVVVTVLARSSVRQLPLAIVGLCIAAGASFALLRWLDLDREIVAEMRTLEDIGEASSIRIDHWLDTLHAVRDFPLTGAGLGSYRFANTAYQQHDPRVWFTYADNQYLEVLVEGGIIGLLLFLSIGACGLVAGFAAWRRSRVKMLNKRQDRPRVSRRLLSSLGGAVTLATLTQAAAAFFDYGVGLPAASSLLVLIIGCVTGFVYSNQPSPNFGDTGAIMVGRFPAAMLQLAAIAAGSAFVVDQYHAARIDDAVVDGYRMINPPYSEAELNSLRSQRRVLAERLQKRPDDPEGLRLLCRLAEAEIRWQVIAENEEISFDDQKAFARIWNQATFRVFLRQLRELKKTNLALSRAKQRDLVAAIEKANLSATVDIAQRRYPFTPELPMIAAAVAIAKEDDAALESQTNLIRFIAPSKSDSLFETGALALLADRKDLTEKLWQASLAASNECRPFMLETARGEWTLAEALERFGPTDYEAAVRAAEKAGGNELSNALWQRVDALWVELDQPVEPDLALLRADHLNQRDKPSELPWLEKILKVHSDNVPLIVRYATRLEQDGRRKESLAQWHRVQFLDPDNEHAKKALAKQADESQSDR